jgi:hypothetical protein
MEQRVEGDYLSCEGYMARLELQRFAVRVRVIEDVSVIAGSLEHGIDLVVARHDGFVLWSGEWKMHVALMNNTVPVMGVSQSICEKRAGNALIGNIILCGGMRVFASVAVITSVSHILRHVLLLPIAAALCVSTTACVCGNGASSQSIPSTFINCTSASRSIVPWSKVML